MLCFLWTAEIWVFGFSILFWRESADLSALWNWNEKKSLILLSTEPHARIVWCSLLNFSESIASCLSENLCCIVHKHSSESLYIALFWFQFGALRYRRGPCARRPSWRTGPAVRWRRLRSSLKPRAAAAATRRSPPVRTPPPGANTYSSPRLVPRLSLKDVQVWKKPRTQLKFPLNSSFSSNFKNTHPHLYSQVVVLTWGCTDVFHIKNTAEDLPA